MFPEHLEGDIPDVRVFIREFVALQKSVTSAAGRDLPAFDHLLQQLKEERRSLQIALTTGGLRKSKEFFG